MMQNSQNSPSISLPNFDFGQIWRQKRLMIRSGIYCAILGFLLFLILPWKSNYEAMVRIEPELTTTGESTSIEAEMDVIQAWDTVSNAVEKMERTTIVKPLRSMIMLHAFYYYDSFEALFSNRPMLSFADYQPVLELGKFEITSEKGDMDYINEKFIFILIIFNICIINIIFIIVVVIYG